MQEKLKHDESRNQSAHVLHGGVFDEVRERRQQIGRDRYDRGDNRQRLAVVIGDVVGLDEACPQPVGPDRAFNGFGQGQHEAGIYEIEGSEGQPRRR